MRERDQAKKAKPDSLAQLLNDLIKVYVLDSLTTTMQLLISQQGEAALRTLTGAAIACYQFLVRDDPVTQQAIKYSMRIIDVIKKIPAIA